jgi:hypothetical protein
MILDLRFKKQILKFALILSVVGLLATGCNQKPSEPAAQEVQGEHSIQIRQKVQGDMSDSLFNIYPSENKTALDLLKMGHKVETKTFKDAGEYVTAINGQKEKTRKNFWAMYVNGKQSTVGASTYKPADKDFIEWKLEVIKK